jgi:hypothetical protein
MRPQWTHTLRLLILVYSTHYSTHICSENDTKRCRLLAASAWEDLQAKSCKGTMNNLNLILIFTFCCQQANYVI